VSLVEERFDVLGRQLRQTRSAERRLQVVDRPLVLGDRVGGLGRPALLLQPLVEQTTNGEAAVAEGEAPVGLALGFAELAGDLVPRLTEQVLALALAVIPAELETGFPAPIRATLDRSFAMSTTTCHHCSLCCVWR